jgi:hypothetical protein
MGRGGLLDNVVLADDVMVSGDVMLDDDMIYPIRNETALAFSLVFSKA